MNKLIVVVIVLFAGLNLFAQNVSEQKYRLAETYEKSGDLTNSSRIYEELVKENASNKSYFDGLVRTFKSMNRYSELLPYVKERYDKSKDIPNAALYGELLWRAGTTNEANEVWEKAIDDFKTNQDVYVQISNTQVQLRLFDRAIAVLNTGRKNLANNTIFSDGLSRLYIAIGDFKSGTSEVLQMLKTDGNLALAQGRIYALLGDDESQKYIQSKLKEYAEANTDNIIAQEFYAWFLRTINRLDQALELYKNIDRIKKANGAELIRFGEDSRRDGQYDIALKAFEIVIDLGKKNPYVQTALYGYARTLEQKILLDKKISAEDAKDIIARYRGIIKDFPGTQQASESRVRIAAIAVAYLKDNATAIEELELAIKERQNSQIAASASLDLANIYINDGKFDKAETILNDVAKRFQNNMQNFSNNAKFLSAEIVYFKGLIDSSLALYAELSIVPETDIANQSLSRIVLIEQNRQFVQGLVTFAAAEYQERRKDLPAAVAKFAEAAQTASGTDLAELALKRKGELELTIGSYQESINTLNSLLKEYPDTIYGDFALMLLGDSHVLLGKKDEAMKFYTDLLVKYPRSIYLNDVRLKIRKLREA